jgi:hypothetical protein
VFSLMRRCIIVLIRKGLIFDISLFLLGEAISILTGEAEIKKKSKELAQSLVNKEQRKEISTNNLKLWSSCKNKRYNNQK